MKKQKTSAKAKKTASKPKKTATKKTQGGKKGSAKDPMKKKTVKAKVSKESTHIITILDQSTSMKDVASAAISGFNEFLATQKLLKGKATMSGVLFSDPERVDALFEGKTLNIKDVPELTSETFKPNGWTALCDGIGKAVNDYKETPAGKLGKEKVLVLVVTDGHENRSRKFTKTDIRDLITYQKKQNWQFIFLCSTEDAYNVSADYGFDIGNTFKFENSNLGNRRLYTKVAKATANYRNMTADFLSSDEGVLRSASLMADVEAED